MLIFKGDVKESVKPKDFLSNVSMIFAENEEEYNDYKSRKGKHTKVFLTGDVRFDKIKDLQNTDSDNWNLPKNPNIKRIIWTPRWISSENNSHFFDYKDKLLDYVENNQDVDFIFRPHPQAFANWNATGELPEDKANELKQRFKNIKNAKIDEEKEFLKTFYSSDFMVTDISSIIVDYFLTEKPIIYCHRTNHFNEFGAKLSEGFYWVHNWEELETAINMLKRGEDPLNEKRKQIIRENFYVNPNGAGKTIKELIKRDFYGKN